MTLSAARGYLTRWQKKLRLQDWEIKLCWMSVEERSDGQNEAFCIWNEEYKYATIKLDPSGEDLKHTIVHELLHLLFDGNQPIAKAFVNKIQKEIALNILAELLVK